MILVIDNYDSFTYNLVQYLGEMGEKIRIFRNDEIDLKGIAQLKPNRIVISPGPCTPKEAGISVDAIKTFAPRIPILGVCLGHQAIGEAFGGKVVRAQRLMHGKVSPVYHDGKGLFQGLANPFVATRYHSLLISPERFPAALAVTARTREKEIMGVRHRQFPTVGVQFHPESILTEVGKALLANFMKMKATWK